ncbi:unnamed protein product [Protopolystoma xenopodis]|uniref:Uncharacterized protein n=1 Tax=Protopolystoma xenopodis TaxID=117903 RepID=A0A3S5CBM6_9PLAT|nr:unnamed protein product [Protopolystoma xenopodis]
MAGWCRLDAELVSTWCLTEGLTVRPNSIGWAVTPEGVENESSSWSNLTVVDPVELRHLLESHFSRLGEVGGGDVTGAQSKQTMEREKKRRATASAGIRCGDCESRAHEAVWLGQAALSGGCVRRE